jgi:putative PIN family toxin of toxin-antitoxin system
MIDTNVFFALLFPKSVPAQAMLHIVQEHTMVLCDHITTELLDKIAEKRPDLLADTDLLLARLPFETVVTPRQPSKLIADPQDAPILNAAILAEVDVIISGDNHFLQLDIENPRVMTAAKFLEDYGV